MIAATLAPQPGDLLQRITGSGQVLEVRRWTGTVVVAWESGVAEYGTHEVRERIESGDWHHVPGDDYREG